MKHVAAALKSWSEQDTLSYSDFEAFVRSAYNRYYYTAYYMTRDGIQKIKRQTAEDNHGQMISAVKKDLLGFFYKKIQRTNSLTKDEKLFMNEKVKYLLYGWSSTYNAFKLAREAADYDLSGSFIKKDAEGICLVQGNKKFNNLEQTDKEIANLKIIINQVSMILEEAGIV